MKAVISDMIRCTGCALCREICPKGCITMQARADGFSYPVIDQSKCVDCHLCEKSCPVNQERAEIAPLAAFAYKHAQNDERNKSASGGVASAFAKRMISEGGAYTGVRLDSHFDAVHDVCESLENIDMFRDSKYVQSDTNGVFSRIKGILESGRGVFVTGAPCQIAAISKYLGKSYEKLILCDLICNGFPSPLVYKEYLAQIEKTRNKKICRFYFRDKTNGWHKSNIKVVFDDFTEDVIERKDSDFYKLFGFNLVLRESCYRCQFRGFNSAADIIIGDYWGLEKKHPEFVDDQGCSVVIINTEKGLNYFNTIKETGEVIETGLGLAVETHPKLLRSVQRNPYRNLFFQMMSLVGLHEATTLCTSANLLRKLERKFLKTILDRKRRDENG